MDLRRKGTMIGVDREAKKTKKGKRIIPIDITIDVLSRLPAKSLVRFRRVCKLWLSVTHDPHFIQTHLRNLSATLLMIPHFLNAHTPDELNINKFDIIRLDCCDDPINPKPIARKSRIFAACNGLLCLSELSESYKIMRVVNPATGESLTLPQTTHDISEECDFWPCLGFEPTKMEYKVVFTLELDDNGGTQICQVFTLGVDTSWRTIHSSIDFCTFGKSGVALNGSIYWQTCYDRDDRALHFDLKDECFHHIALPNFENLYGDGNHDVRPDFVGMQGSLCLPVFPNVTDSDILSRMDIWVMTSGSNEWSMKYSIMFPWDPYSPPHPLLIHNNKILINDYRPGTRLQYHDLHPNGNGNNNTYGEIYYDNDICRIAFVTAESLVPLPT